MLLPGCGFGRCHMRIHGVFARLRKQQRNDCQRFHDSRLLDWMTDSNAVQPIRQQNLLWISLKLLCS
jgi:hypothetical protein